MIDKFVDKSVAILALLLHICPIWPMAGAGQLASKGRPQPFNLMGLETPSFVAFPGFPSAGRLDSAKGAGPVSLNDIQIAMPVPETAGGDPHSK